MLEKRLKYINDFFNNRISNIIKKLEKDYNTNEFDTIKVHAITTYDLYRLGFFYIEIIGCYFDENYIEHETYSYKISVDMKDVQENEFEDVSDFVWRLEYTINDKYTNKKIEQYKYD